MLLLDVLIRYSAVTLLLLLCLFIGRDGRRSQPAFYAVFVCISVGAMLLTTAPEVLRLPEHFFKIARIIDVTNIGFVWWLGLSILKDDFKLGPIEWAGFILSSGGVLIFRLIEFGMDIIPPPSLGMAIDVLNFAMMGHLVYIALRGRSDDLIEQRRTLRLYFVAALTFATILAVTAENLLMSTHNTELSILRAAIALILALWALLWLTTFHPEKLSFTKPKPHKPSSAMDPRDDNLRARLNALMDEEHIYLEHNLTIRKLASRLKTPEHRLRALINQGMEYRNFSAYLNTYRLAAVKSAFADPALARTPVLTIAMDAGYASLAPFNRAFLKSEGVTPSVYRQSLPST